MARYDSWRADSFCFNVTGRGAQGLFTAAARQSIRLWGIQCDPDGYTARASGRDRATLEALAARGGWHFTVESRRGPGHWLERALRRPGVPLGLALFCVLLKLLGGFVWVMDFAGLDAAQTAALRDMLDQNNIREGVWLTQEALLAAQRALSLHSEDLGWLSLNFTGGCLTLESTPAERQPIAAAPDNTALYAKADGEILAVETDSGFAAVVPGQYVARGKLLVAAARLDHGGAPVTQAADGRIMARVEQSFTAEQPLRTMRSILTGRHSETVTLYLPGVTRVLGAAEDYTEAECTERWQPLRMGRIALPGCLHIEEKWERQTVELCYSPEQTASMARRACRLQLAQAFPDAVVEAQAVQTAADEDGVRYTVHYVFTADIAQSEPDRGEALP